jgi:two-component system, NarL family, response regulator
MPTSNPQSVTKVLLVDDHGVVREGISSVFELSGQFCLVGSVGCGEAAFRAIERFEPDVVLLDLRLPDISGLEVLRRLRLAASKVKVIVLSSNDSDQTIRQALDLGARGYVVKRAGVVPLLEALEAVAAGRIYLSADAEAQLSEHLTDETLSAREIQILRLAAQGLTNVQIGKKTDITERTVKFHMTSLMQKLKAGDRTHAVSIALRRGFFEL